MKYKVKMLKNIKGVNDGKMYPELFKKDKEYEIGKDLFKAFTELGVISLVEEEIKEEKKQELKKVKKEAENKMLNPKYKEKKIKIIKKDKKRGKK